MKPTATGKRKIFVGECQTILPRLAADSVSCVVTDPPFNTEVVGIDWNQQEVDRRLEHIAHTTSTTLVKNLPYGNGLAGGARTPRWYQRNQTNNLDYAAWVTEWATQLLRVCKSGALVAVFSSPRSLAHVQVGLEAAGFFARDVIVYRRNSGIPRGLNLSRKLAKLGDPAAAKLWQGWHSCLRSEWDAIVLVQKPLLGNNVATVAATGVGPLRTVTSGSGGFLSNLLLEGFVKTHEDRQWNDQHCSVKPLSLIKFLISTLVQATPVVPHPIVLDPFAGTGTTGVAALELGLRTILIEREPKYLQICQQRCQPQRRKNF